MRRQLGLLACDSIWEPLRSHFGDYAEMYTALLQAAGADFELKVFAVHQGVLPAHPDDCDAWLISGSRAGVYDAQPWIAALEKFARAAHAIEVPQVGICFGHQLLAQALGGRIERAATGWGLGNLEVELRGASACPAPTSGRLRLFMAHQDQVVTLPPGAQWLATAAHCRHAAFALGEQVLGIQAHPEFTPDFMREMTLEASFEVPPAVRAAALSSYAEPVDSAVIGRWIATFLGLLS